MSICESAEDTLLKANIEFLDKNFKSALEMYNLTIELDDTISDAFLKRALCFEKLKKFNDAIADTNQAIALDPMNCKAYYHKGVISLDLDDSQTALECFEKCQALDSKDSIIQAWIHKCKSTSQSSKPRPPTSTTTSTSSSSRPEPTPSASSSASGPRPQQPARPAAPMAPKAPRAPKVSAQTKPKEPEKPAPTPTPAPVAEPSHATIPPPSAQRYTWYQTDSFVVVTVFVKAAKPEAVSIEFETNSLGVSIELSTDNQFLLDLDLAHDIDTQASKYEVMSTKVEIKMKKASPVKWNTIERKEELAPPPKKQTKNWDKILATEEEEKDPGFNQLMKDMYSGASEEERRAMMKSFHESGGTVLSCDWKDVSKAHVDPKPPTGVTRYEKDYV